MLPFITVFDRQIPTYGIFFFLGIFAAAGVAVLLCRRKSVLSYDIVYSAIYTMIGAIIGAKLLFVIVTLPQIIEQHLNPLLLLQGGFVFYGGLIGGALGLWIYCRQFRIKLFPFLEIYALVLPLGHAFGRVGCFLAGCCYGIPYDGFLSCTYHISIANTPVGIPLLPIQLIEAGGLLLIFIALLIVYWKTGDRIGMTPRIYLFSYSILRFVLEFFRGDAERGTWAALSTSQWICLLLFAISIMTLRSGVTSKQHKAPAQSKQ